MRALRTRTTALAGVLLGCVRDAERGDPAAAGVVEVRWSEVRIDARGVHRDMQRVRAAGGPGRALRGVPTDVPVLVQAMAGAGPRPEAASGAIEVYSDPNMAPVQYAWGNCAIVLVWTKARVR